MKKATKEKRKRKRDLKKWKKKNWLPKILKRKKITSDLRLERKRSKDATS